MRLADFGISNTQPAFIVAEISGNHAGEKNSCIDLIDVASAVGANAVKFQTYTADTITLNSEEPDFILPSNSPWASYSNYYKLYAEAYTPWEWQSDLFDYARTKGILPFSSAFDETSVDFLESIACPLYKLASPEINHLPLINKLAKTGKPILISLGVASQSHLEKAILEIKDNSSSEIVIMQCDTNYPAETQNANIAQIPFLREKYKHLVGYSDHTKSSISAVLAIGFGAKVVEKHLTSSAIGDSVDSFFSTSESDFASYIKDIRSAESAIGNQIFRNLNSSTSVTSSRSIYPTRNISKGEIFSAGNLGVFRPGLSLAPSLMNTILGKTAQRNLRIGERLSMDDIEL